LPTATDGPDRSVATSPPVVLFVSHWLISHLLGSQWPVDSPELTHWRGGVGQAPGGKLGGACPLPDLEGRGEDSAAEQPVAPHPVRSAAKEAPCRDLRRYDSRDVDGGSTGTVAPGGGTERRSGTSRETGS